MPRLLSTSSNSRWCVRTLSDAVPPSWVLHKVLHNGKMAAACMVLIYLGMLFVIVMIIWPIHWVARLILLVVLPQQGRDYSEALMYLLFVFLVQWIGRKIVYSLVFPGSSDRFGSDIAFDFATYSLRVLNQVLDAGLELNAQNVQHRLSRMVQYRDRILVVYRDVFHCLYYQNGVAPSVHHDPVTPTSSSTASTKLGTSSGGSASTSTDEEGRCCTITRTSSSYGTNTIQGDIGPLFPFFLAPNLTPPCSNRRNALEQLQHTIIQQLSNIITDIDAIEAQFLTTSTGNRNAPPHQQRQQLLAQTIPNLASHCTTLKDTLNTKLFIPKQEDGDKPKSKRIALRNIIGKVGSFFLGMFDPLYFDYDKLDPSKNNTDLEDTSAFQASAIFNMHVLRGCFLSRYRGAKQIWIPRATSSSKSSTTDGFLDCIIIPPPSYEPTQPRKVVIYCNPNAGLYEVATGFNLMGGNIVSSKQEEDTNNWTDFYLNLGYHVVLFNYAGYGRSFGDSNTCCWSLYRKPCARRLSSPRYHDVYCANQFYSWWLQKSFRRVWYSIFFGWKSTSTSHWKLSPESLKADGFTVANFVISSYNNNEIKSLDKLVIHGESIGGMVAASTAKLLSTSCQTPVPLLLVCDRTFCNLIATAQRLVGGWSGPAIRMLMPFWNTNVASDFLAARCPKVVANDPADAIISDPSSLRSGLAVYSELLSTAKKHRYNIDGVGLIWDAPVFHRMSEWENIGIYESRFSKTMAALTVAPVWPKDRHFTTLEAFHFAACVRRIFKLATSARLNLESEVADNNTSSKHEATFDEGIELSCSGDINNGFNSGIEEDSNDSRLLSTPLLSDIDEKNYPFVSSFAQDVWKILARCDGLYGLTLGSAVQGGGADSIVSWLCSVVVFGCQTLAYSMERRLINASSSTSKHNIIPLNSRDDWTSHEVELDDYSAHLKSNPLTVQYPLTIPEVITQLRNKIDTFYRKDKGLIGIERELQYCLEILEYIKARVSSNQVLISSLENMNFTFEGDSCSVTGSFFRLHCGHNNQFSSDEKEYFKILLRDSQNYYKKPET